LNLCAMLMSNSLCSRCESNIHLVFILAVTVNAVTQKLYNLRKFLNRNKFSGLMSLYDNNFNAFMRLMPDLHQLPILCCSRVTGSPDLYVEVLERCKFTTIIKLTYFFELKETDAESVLNPESSDQQRTEFIPDPDLTIRVYHDAKVVEAVSCKEQGFMPIGTSDPHDVEQLQCRWESNLFLQKWLQYMVELGHKFDMNNIYELKELPCVI